MHQQQRQEEKQEKKLDFEAVEKRGRSFSLDFSNR